MSALVSPNLLLPWANIPQENRRLNLALGLGALVFVLFFAVVKWVELPPPVKPAPVATTLMIVDQPVVLPPPPIPVEPPPPEPEKVEPEPKPEPKPDPKPEQKPEPKPEPKPVKTEPVKTPVKETAANNTEVKLDNARKQAASAGVMQAQNELAAMRDSLDISDVAKPTDAAPTDNSAANTAATVDRAVISSGAMAKSGGISVAALSKDTGGGGSLGGRKGTAVENKLKAADQAAAAKQAAAGAGGGKGSRTDEELKRVLGAAQARIDRMYRSALDEDPTLQGRMVFKLTIEPNGSVSNVQLVSSALKNDDLQRKVTTLLRSLNFGARDVAVFTQAVPIDFFPS